VGKSQPLEVEGRAVPVSSLDKVLYPAANFTKGQVIQYYVEVAHLLLPHLAGRPVTLKRYPNGVRGKHFYEKDAPAFTPDWVRTYPVPRRDGGPDIHYVVIDDLPTLVWSANLANLEIHPFLHRVPEIDSPLALVFDLDPGEGAGVLDCAEVAFRVRGMMDRLGLECCAKVSGSKGLQVYVPLNSGADYALTRPFAKAVAQLLEREDPGRIVSGMAKSARERKVFIDWSQNADFKTTVGAYSLRAKRARPYVSVPVTWDELRRALEKKDADALYWEPDAALARFRKMGDLFGDVLTRKQRLPEAVLAASGGATAVAKTKRASASPGSQGGRKPRRNQER
jgi:bifunctional non-homologous end joining protein LigD